MTALGWTLAVVWICAVFGAAILIGRFLDLADRGTTTADRAEWPPFDAVPLPARPAPFWTDRFFAIVDAEPELHDRLLAIVDETRWLA